MTPFTSFTRKCGFATFLDPRGGRAPRGGVLGALTSRPRARILALALATSVVAAAPARADGDKWPLAGRQGIIQFVIVPPEQARDREAYAKQLNQLCEPNLTCFINFYTNSTGAPLAVPLPDAIDKESTAIFRRSTKQGAELFRWSCRMATGDGDCF